jgi:tRNA pseudouridine32 synthase/23S rRNA pseudouridine746 synthase/23S rRNA pseudouridine955/2504/2580 synthase
VRRLERARAERLWVVHRLDRDTSGVLVLARDAERHRAWSMAFEQGRVEKEYLAFTAGPPTARDCRAALVEGERGGMRVATNGERGKPAHTRFETLRRWTRAALVRAQPFTGRTHQIRVHLAQLEAPILGDPLYNPIPTDLPVPRLALHAARLVAPPEVGGDEVSAPMPADLVALQKHLERGPQ